jgi:hypothetical protein
MSSSHGAHRFQFRSRSEGENKEYCTVGEGTDRRQDMNSDQFTEPSPVLDPVNTEMSMQFSTSIYW